MAHFSIILDVKILCVGRNYIYEDRRSNQRSKKSSGYIIVPDKFFAKIEELNAFRRENGVPEVKPMEYIRECFEKAMSNTDMAVCFLNNNFGSVSKSDLELIFFSILMEHLQANNLSTDDYFISNILGITQQRVRNLKIKNQLRNQYAYDWKAELMRLARIARYSDDDRYITISLDNPILMIEIQHFIETKGGMVDFSLNPKLLKMQTCDFAVLLLEIGMAKNEKAVWKLLREKYRAEAIRMHPVRICDLYKILLYAAFMDMNPPLIRTCFRHNFKSPFTHSDFSGGIDFPFLMYKLYQK